MKDYILSVAEREESQVVAAAHAVASWARARRATWTPADAAQPEPPAAAVPVPSSTKPSSPPRPLEGAAPHPPAPSFGGFAEPLAAPIAMPRPAAPTEPARPVSLFDSRADEEPTASGSRVGRIAASVAIVGVLGLGARYLLTRPHTEPPPVATRAETPRPPAPRAGSLHVTSTPPGAQVVVDGKARGVTPLTIDALPPGHHTVELQSGEGSIRRTVAIAAGKTAEVDEAIYAGWLVVYAPFEIAAAENGRALRADERNQIMLSPGSHQLRLVNATLGFEDTRMIEVKPGQVTTVYVTPPPSSLTITASEAADVLVDGKPAGATPLTGFPVALGTHEIVVRRAAGGERRLSVTVTTRPLTLDVDFSRPGDR